MDTGKMVSLFVKSVLDTRYCLDLVPGWMVLLHGHEITVSSP